MVRNDLIFLTYLIDCIHVTLLEVFQVLARKLVELLKFRSIVDLARDDTLENLRANE